MSRVCPVSGKGPLSGNRRSHSMRATRRVFNVNLQNHKVNINGQWVEMRLSSRAYRALNKSRKGEASPAVGEVTGKPAAKTEKATVTAAEKAVEAKADAKK